MRRIDINENLEKALEKIKREHYIYGKGYSNTIGFLVDYYIKTEGIIQVCTKEISEITPTIEKALRKVFRDFIANLFTESHKPTNT